MLNEAAPDGRHLRSERSRGAIARSMLELVRETGHMPTTDIVADRAGVSRRSVFRHYSDVSELLAAAYELQRVESYNRQVPIDLDAGSLDARVESFTQRVCDIYECVMPVRRAAVYLARDYPVLEQLMRADDAAHRAYVVSAFSDDLSGRAAQEGELLVAAMVAATSWSNWQSLRSDQDLSVEQARAVVQTAVKSLLAYAA